MWLRPLLNMVHWAELIRALASLLWPAFAFVALWLFRSELRELLRRLSRLRRGKVFGQEIELDEELDQLRASAERAQKAAVQLPRSHQEALPEPLGTFENELLLKAGESPKAALLLLGSRIEGELKQLLAATGWANHIDAASMSDAVEQLRVQGSLPSSVTGSLKLFLDVRNRLLHSGGATDEDVLRAVDSGLVLLKAIRAIPAETNVVRETSVTLFGDEACKRPLQNVTGILLETTSPGGAKKSLRIFPTTRAHFQKGKRVAWEWNPKAQWGSAWYKDPESRAIQQAWHSSCEFIGRHLEDLH